VNRPFNFDPSVFISKPYILCPQCSLQDFGVLSIQSDRYIRRCRRCHYTQTRSLPQLRKKVLYLDQFAISNLYKAASSDDPDGVWSNILDKLKRVIAMQLVVCPSSEFHQAESLVYRFYDDLRNFYESLSGGIRFRPSIHIHCEQLVLLLRDFLSVSPFSLPQLRQNRWAFESDPDVWVDRLIVGARVTYTDDAVEAVRAARERVHEDLLPTFRSWQLGAQSFAEVFEHEARGWVEAVIGGYLSYLERIDAISTGTSETPLNPYPNEAALIIKCLNNAASDSGIPGDQTLDRTLDFLRSEQVLRAPFLKIMALLFAGAARKAAAGQRRPPTRGFSTDVRMISTLLPCCDGILVDNECAALLREQPLVHEVDFGAKVFSLNARSDLVDWLDTVESSASAEHKAILNEVYGDRWH